MSDEARNAAKVRLQQLLNEINDAKNVIALDLSMWDPRTVTGMVTRKRQAEDDIKGLIAGYNALITNSVVKVFVTGDRAEEFANKASSEGAVSVDAAAMYKEYAKAVEPTMSREHRNFTTTQLIVMAQVLQLYMAKHNVFAVQQPKLDALDMDVPCPTFNDVVNMCRKAVRNTSGDDLIVRELGTAIFDACLKKNAATTVVPVVLFGLTAEETQSLEKKLFGSQPSITINATSETTDEQLIAEINEKILQLFKKP